MHAKRKIISIARSIALALATGVCLTAYAAPPTPPAETVSASIILNVTDPQALRDYIQATLTPGDKDFHRFLTVGQFRTRYAPSTQQIMKLVHYLRSFGITIDKIYADNLDITISGTAAQFNAAFGTQLQDFVKNGKRFHRPAHKYSLPSDISGLVLGVAGLDSESGRLHPMLSRAQPSTLARAQGLQSGGYPAMVWPTSSTTTGVPGEYTVGDVANFYQVNPLYQAGFSGRGQTVGIMTFANFNIADVEAYWSDIGLKVAPNRITKEMVDGGTPVQPNVGDDETSLDVEQSGGLAPQAKIQVYVAPNTNQASVDVFYAAVSDNSSDTLSISWGLAEEFDFAAANGGEDFTYLMRETDQALMEAAAQGQSVFTAAGDDGAYDAYRDLPGLNAQLTVDYPASDPYITAAGGTTMSGLQLYLGPGGSIIPINIAQEQVWGWDYLTPLCNAYGLDPTSCGIAYGGGGGGVSSFWSLPYYQQATAGITQTQPNQPLICETAFSCSLFGLGAPPQTVLTLPGGFAGRNVPDLSLNADPETGYVLVDCTDFPEPANPGCAATYFGGTSFVAPQLNGITTLVDQASGSRVGFLNPTVYAFQSVFGYGSDTPFNDITAGDNWFYHGVPGYDNGAGIGTINAANLARAYQFMDAHGYMH
ncbi:MAG: putative periplasmic aspartyl protease [Rhodanobacteraceae bacterium]|jgi:subtilase family serine protease|nr:MAG: putative periplasmic aspartyl protease [Rhodanobacteraceae bacterium]